MILAVLGGIDGNVAALRAALDAIDAQGILTIVHTGNSIVGGDDAGAVMELLRKAGVRSVQGSEDRQVGRLRRKAGRLRDAVEEDRFAALERAHAQAPSTVLEALLARPHTLQFEIDGVRILVCHGAPGHSSDQVDQNTSDARLERYRESGDADIVIAGGARDAFSRLVVDTLIAGPGKVDHAPGVAGYLLVSTEQVPWTATFQTVPYATA